MHWGFLQFVLLLSIILFLFIYLFKNYYPSQAPSRLITLSLYRLKKLQTTLLVLFTMQYKVLVAAFAASALAANHTNGSNTTTTGLPPISSANSAGQIANIGALGAAVAGGVAFLF